MPNPKPQPLPPQREPVSATRALVEGAAILTPLATVISWLATLLPIEIPANVQAAIAALVVSIGTVLFSKRRDVVHTAKLGTVALVLLVALVVGCVSYNGGAYRELATAQVVRLQGEPSELALSPQVCDALLAGARFLRMDGPDSSAKIPLFAGNGVEDLAQVHERQASICYELARRDAGRGVGETLRDRNRAAWGKTWRSGRSLLGGAN